MKRLDCLDELTVREVVDNVIDELSRTLDLIDNSCESLSDPEQELSDDIKISLDRLYSLNDYIEKMDDNECPICGHKTVTYKHTMNNTLVSALTKLKNHNGKGKVSEIGLSYSEFGNMQKLYYFGLIDKEKTVYILNDLGKAFLNKKKYIPDSVYTKNGKVIAYSGTLCCIDDFCVKPIIS